MLAVVELDQYPIGLNLCDKNIVQVVRNTLARRYLLDRPPPIGGKPSLGDPLAVDRDRLELQILQCLSKPLGKRIPLNQSGRRR